MDCRKLRDIKRGDQIVCGMQGIRVSPDVQQRDKPSFGFMSNEVSSERRVETSVARVADMMRRVKADGGKIAFVAGPVVVHTGGSQYFCELIRRGYVDVLLSGNALAVHDIEVALSGTSLGIDLNSGHPVEHGHRNHMRAINAVRRAGGIARAVETGRADARASCTPATRTASATSSPDRSATTARCRRRSWTWSRRRTPTRKALEGVDVVVMLSSMLHSIGVGNMLPSWVKVICVDINPAVVTKLSDRGSTQTVGVVTDVGLFLHTLAEKLRALDLNARSLISVANVRDPHMHKTLITPSVLASHLNDPSWVVIDCRFDLTDPSKGEELYRDGHIPGARYAHLDQHLSGEKTGTNGRHPLPEPEAICRNFGELGISPFSQVIAYDADNGMFASAAVVDAALDGPRRAWRCSTADWRDGSARVTR